MSQSDEPVSSLQTKINDLLLIIGCLVLGGAMVYAPNMFDDVHATGRRSLIKLIFKQVWGIPVGIIVLVIGCLLIYLFYKDYFKQEE